jgi:hypothetical protein
MRKQIEDFIRRVNFHIWRISKIRKYLNSETMACLMSAFLLILIDNGNLLLAGLLAHQIQRLHLFQNSSVCLVNRTQKMDHITSVNSFIGYRFRPGVNSKLLLLLIAMFMTWQPSSLLSC